MFSSLTPEETPEEEFFPLFRLRSESCWDVGVEKSDSTSFCCSFTGAIVESWDDLIVGVASRLGIGKEETLMKFGDGRRPPGKRVERRLMVWRFVDKPMIESLDLGRESCSTESRWSRGRNSLGERERESVV